MNCWICGDKASSGEHKIKASDLRSLFGRVNQKTPLYIHTDAKRNQAVGGIKSDRLKFKSLLCERCNNQRTQPHDRAWEKLSNYLRSRQPPIRPGSIVRLDTVFPGSVRKSMLDVHLFFLKLFGCIIREHSVLLDLAPFSSAILGQSPHPKVHLAFWAVTDTRFHTRAGQSSINTAQLQGHVAFASWFYFVGALSVNVMYAEPSEHRRGLRQAWHPHSISKRLHIVGE